MGVGLVAETDATAERILAGQNRRTAVSLTMTTGAGSLRTNAAAVHRNCHRLQVVRAHEPIPGRERFAIVAGQRPPFDPDVMSLSPRERHDRRDARRLHARQRRRPFEQPIVERDPLRPGRILRRRREHRAGEHTLRIESEVDACSRRKVRSSRPLPTSRTSASATSATIRVAPGALARRRRPCRAPPSLSAAGEVGARRLQRRHEAEQRCRSASDSAAVNARTARRG